jgi:hypothetical protein
LLGATSRDPSGPELVFWHELLHIRSRPTTTSPTVRLAALVTVTCNSHLTSHSRLQLIETAADTMSDGTRRRQTWSVEDWPGPSSVLANISGDERGCHARMGPRGDAAEHDGVGSGRTAWLRVGEGASPPLPSENDVAACGCVASHRLHGPTRRRDDLALRSSRERAQSERRVGRGASPRHLNRRNVRPPSVEPVGPHMPSILRGSLGSP